MTEAEWKRKVDYLNFKINTSIGSHLVVRYKLQLENLIANKPKLVTE